MLQIAGYQLDGQLHQSNNSVVYRGQNLATHQAVILKILTGMQLTAERIAWFKQEYELTHSLALSGVVQAHQLAQINGQWVMELEDFGGDSLNQLGLAGQLEVAEFLSIALSATTALSQLHQQQIIHKDINPSNITYNKATGQVKLIDLGLSTRLSHEKFELNNPNVLEGTLAYISPEQTGRMNRPLDYRTDLYSLGVTFYELLTGQLPFAAKEAIELVYLHLTHTAPPVHEIKPTIPVILSHIVAKLMAKNAEDRYQSAAGLQYDLEQLAEAVRSKEQEVGNNLLLTPSSWGSVITRGDFNCLKSSMGARRNCMFC